jgi:hypothetical protein
MIIDLSSGFFSPSGIALVSEMRQVGGQPVLLRNRQVCDCGPDLLDAHAEG